MSKELNNAFVTAEKKNGRYILEFLRMQSANFESFVALPIYYNAKTNWASLFEFLAHLRNLIAHQNSRITNDSKNELRSLSSELFNNYFEIVEKEGDEYIFFKRSNDQFGGLINCIENFSSNAAKFIADERDLTFLGLF